MVGHNFLTEISTELWKFWPLLNLIRNVGKFWPNIVYFDRKSVTIIIVTDRSQSVEQNFDGFWPSGQKTWSVINFDRSVKIDQNFSDRLSPIGHNPWHHILFFSRVPFPPFIHGLQSQLHYRHSSFFIDTQRTPPSSFSILQFCSSVGLLNSRNLRIDRSGAQQAAATAVRFNTSGGSRWGN